MSETGLFFLGWALVGYGSMMGVYLRGPFR